MNDVSVTSVNNFALEQSTLSQTSSTDLNSQLVIRAEEIQFMTCSMLIVLTVQHKLDFSTEFKWNRYTLGHSHAAPGSITCTQSRRCA